MAYIQKIKVGESTIDIQALHFITDSLDTPESWKNYIDELVGKGLQIVIDTQATGKEEPATTASASTMGKLYLVNISGQKAGSYTEFVTIENPTGTYKWEKIGTTDTDLTQYAKKTEAGKADTYTSTEAGEGNTGEAGAQTATGTASVTYQKSAEATGSAGAATITSAAAHGEAAATTGAAGAATVNFSEATFTGTAATITVEAEAVELENHSYKPEGTISNTYTAAGKTNVLSGVTAALAATPEFTGTTAIISVSGDVTGTSVDSHSYKPEGTISKIEAAAHSHVVNLATDTVENNVTGTATGAAGTHSHSVTAAGSISVGTGTANYTPAGTISAVTAAAHSHTVNCATESYTAITGIPNFSGGSLTGTKTFNTDAIKEISLAASTDTTSGPAYVESVTHTAASLTGDTTFVKSISDWDGGSLGGTTTFNTDAIKSISGTKNYGFAASQSSVMTAPTVDAYGVLSWTTVAASTQDGHTGDAASTASVTLTAATCTITNGAVGISGGSISPVTKYMSHSTTAASNGTVGYTAAALGTLTKGTITYVTGATTSAAGDIDVTPTFTGSGVELKFTGSAVTSSTVADHTHSLTHSDLTYVTGATLNTAGAIDVTPTFTGKTATLTHTVNQGSFSTSTSYQPAGTVSQPSITVTPTTVAVNNDAIKAVTSTFAGTTATISHTFTSTSATVSMSGSYTPAGTISGTQTIADHSHSYVKPADHSHSVTIASHTHSIALADATATGDASVAVSAHTHTIGNHTHNVTVAPISAA